MKSVIQIRNLKKRFFQQGKGKKTAVEAVSGITLSVNQGEIFGFLGPNGAGKTTTLRMLTTLLPIDEGEALVAGYDLKTYPQEVRKHIGYVSQLGGADPSATGRENLILTGRLYGMGKEDSLRRAYELIDVFDLKEIVDRGVKTYSGGQKRRLELALGIIHEPEVLFLDEPTTGLDPQNRANLWDQIRRLRDGGTTVFLTTHYLEEADELADRLTIMDRGKIVAEGTPRKLKQQIAGDVIVLKPKQSVEEIAKIGGYLQLESFVREAHVQGEAIHIYVEDGTKAMPRIFNLMEAKNITIDTISMSQPSLDDVFLKQTGRSLRDAGANGEGK